MYKKKGCPISSKSVIFGLDPKIHLIAVQEIAASKQGRQAMPLSAAMTHTYWSSPLQ